VSEAHLEPKPAPTPETGSTTIAGTIANGSARRDTDRSLAGSLIWRAAADWTSQILTWTSLLVIVRLLTPADFGIAAMAVAFFPYLRYLSEFGVPQTIITMRDLTESQIAQLNTVALLLGMACLGIGASIAWPIAWFFRIPRLAPVVIVTCLALIPLGARAVPEGLLRKEMKFKLLSLFDALRDIVSAIATLALAWIGFGYWALILGNVVGTTARALLIVVTRPHSLAWPRLDQIKKPLLFGWHILVSVAAWSAYERLDNVTAGRMLGQTSLGFYGMAWNLANVPIEKLTSLVTTVLPSYLAAAQKDPIGLRRYVRTLTEVLALATFPATIGLGLVARDLIPLVLGHKWDGIILPLQILSTYAAFRSIVALLPKILTAIGNARFVMWNDLAALVILPSAFYVGAHWGTAGIAWGWVVAYPLVAFPLYWKVFRTIQMNPWEYFRSLRPALDSTLAMVFAVGLLKWQLPERAPLLVRLILETGVGVIAYVSTAWLLHRPRMLGFLEMVKTLRRQKATALA
jgi:teichuronic acid exporter